MREALGRRVVRVLRFAELDLEIAPLGDGQCIGDCLGIITEEFRHLRGRFEVKLRHVAHPFLIGHVRARADADEDIVRLVMPALEKVNVVRGDEPQAQFLRDLGQRTVCLDLRLDAVVLHLDEKVFRAKDVPVLRREFQTRADIGLPRARN